MKKIASFIIAICFGCLLSQSVLAIGEKSADKNTDISSLFFDDGSYIIIELKYLATEEKTANTITGSKSVTKYDSNHEILWQYVLVGTFTYNIGVSSECIDAEYSYYIADESWTFSNGNAYASENIAYGEGTFTHRVLLLSSNVFIDISIQCDTNGNLS